MFTLQVWVNPLGAFGKNAEDFSPEKVLSFLCGDRESDPASIAEKYAAITDVQPGLFAFPQEDRILNQLLWPLRYAKTSYMVGNFLGTIALAGIAAEMTAVFLFDLVQSSRPDGPMPKERQELLYGRTFEDLEQTRRIAVLKAYGVLSSEMIDAFGRIRGTRRQHLHLAKTPDREHLATDARTMFRDAVALVASAIGQDFREGKLVLRGDVVRYLEEAGIITRQSGDQEGGGDPAPTKG